MFARAAQLRQFLVSIRFFFTRQLLTKAVSLLIVFSLFANTTPAAPEVMLASATEFGQDVRYAYLTSPTLTYLSELSLWDNPVLAFFLGKGKKQTKISKIVISPDTTTIREGEEIVFTAIAFDGQDKRASRTFL